MKTIFILLLTICCMVSFSCLSTPPTYGSSAFTETSKTSRDDVRTFTDKFTGGKTYEYTKGLRGGFALSRGGLTVDYLEIYPYLIINEDNICSPFIEIKYVGSEGALLSTGADKTYKKFIFLSDGERLEISPIVNPGKDDHTYIADKSVFTDYASSYSMQLTKKQFDVLRDYFSTKDKVECAAYSVDGKSVTFKSYNNKWHKGVFTALDDCVKTENPNIEYNEDFTQAIIK